LPKLDGVLLDLGVSSYQLEDNQRGFSIYNEAPLGMNFDYDGGKRASAIVNQYPEFKLAEIIWKYGQERWSRRIARKIVEERAKTPIETTSHLVRTICSAIPRTKGRWKIHPATRTFQALRIEINQELENLNQFLQGVWDCLGSGGRLCIISFHSLEDALVKKYFRDLAGQKDKTSEQKRVVDVLTKKPIRPSSEEIKMNPRSRSAKMRVAECH
jgi:16S rRNA (cytosine1402-N4)-methyltransferase